MTPPSTGDIKRGHIFWATSQGIEQEEQDEHPWVILSDHRLLAGGKLVIGIPLTSNGIVYNEWEVRLGAAEIEVYQGVQHPLNSASLNDGKAKCHKLRHWSPARITELVGRMEPEFVHKLLRTAMDAFPVPRRGR